MFVLDTSDLLDMLSEVDASVTLLTVSFYLRNVRPLLKRRLPPFLVVREWSIRYAHRTETFQVIPSRCPRDSDSIGLKPFSYSFFILEMLIMKDICCFRGHK